MRTRYRGAVDMNCMPIPFGILCWMEDHSPGRDSEAIHNGDEPEDWICKLHDNAMWIAAVLRVPVGRGTWRK